MFLQEVVSTNENLSQPLEYLGVIINLMLNQLLGDGEQHLRAEK